MSRVIGIGAALLDFMVQSSLFPEEDTKLMADSLMFQGGGPCSTALVALAKLGVETGYLGTVGDDLAGHHILEEFRRYGVDSSQIEVIQGYSSSASFVLSNTNKGTRTCVWSRGSLPNFRWVPTMQNSLDAASILHLDGNHLDAAIPAAQYMQSQGRLVSLDAGGLYPGIDRLLPFVDILIPSEEFALGYTRETTAENAIEALRKAYCPKVLVITKGKNGGIYFDEATNSIQNYPAYPVKVVDSNGAGDVFHGSFLMGMLKGLSTADSCKFASAVSALKCTVFGAREGIPSLESTLAFLKANGVRITI